MYNSASSLEDRIDGREMLDDGVEAGPSKTVHGVMDNVDKTDGGNEMTRRRFPEEYDEDILRDSNDRFVLFPIKYHEVSVKAHQECEQILMWMAR